MECLKRQRLLFVACAEKRLRKEDREEGGEEQHEMAWGDDQRSGVGER